MKLRKLAKQSCSKVLVLLAAILPVSPTSASVLCIAPGGHVAIEDLNAPCCAPSRIASPAKDQPDNGFTGAGDCRNCTDLFMTPNGRGAVTESFSNASAGTFAEECFGASSASLGLLPQIAFSYFEVPLRISASVPLRC